MAVSEEADVAYPVKAIGYGVLQKSTNEFVGRERHNFRFAFMPIVLPGEADLIALDPHQTTVGNGNSMRVPAEISEYLFGAGERRLRENHPIDLGRRVEPSSKGDRIRQTRKHSGETEFTAGKGDAHLIEE
jgi:hypothetical protein